MEYLDCCRYRKSLFKRDEALNQLDLAIKERNRVMIENAVDNCVENGIHEDKILDAQEFLDVVMQEDKIIEKVVEAFRSQDLDLLENLINEFR